MLLISPPMPKLKAERTEMMEMVVGSTSNT